MEFLEKNLEDIIFKTNAENLIIRGLNLSGKKFRQVRIGNFGIADLVTLNRSTYHPQERNKIFITIYELKKNVIDLNTLGQACRYYKGIKTYIDNSSLFKNADIIYKIVLIGKNVEYKGDFKYVCDYIISDYLLDIYTYKYDFDGIIFEHKNKSIF
jgi:hypothetical protein